MSTNHHTPHPFGGPVTSDAFNSRLGELDAAIDVVQGSMAGASTTLTGQATAGQADLDVVSATGFAVGDAVWIGTPGSGLQEAGIIDSIVGTTITLAENLTNTHAAGQPVSRSPAEIVDARGGASTLGSRLKWLDRGVVNVQQYGAVGDDVANDVSAIQAAIDVTPDHGILVFPAPPARYRLNGARLNVTRPMTIVSDLAEIHQETAGTGIFLVTASDVTLAGLRLTGPGHTADGGVADTAITVTGASAAAPVSRFTARGNVISGFGFYGVEMHHVQDFEVVHNTIFDLWYNGIHGGSCIRGIVAHNNIRNLVANSGANQQPSGIAFGRLETDSLVTDPPSSDILISDNLVEDSTWQGLDTHGGRRMIFANNRLRNCGRAIQVGPSDDSLNAETWAPIDCLVIGNDITSGVADGSAQPGITFSGAHSGAAVIQRATGAVIGNVIRGHGTDEAGGGLSAGIYIHTTLGVIVAGNSIFEPSPTGINVYHDNEGFAVSGNTIVDAWSDLGATVVAAIATRSTNNRGTIAGNTLGRGSKSAAVVNNWGLRIAADAGGGTTVHLGINNMEAATTPLSDGGGQAQTLIRATKLGFYSATPMLKPTVTGSRGGNAALASLLDQLEALGLITDSST